MICLAELPKAGDIVYYIPAHKIKRKENAEKGVVSTVNKRGIFVKYTTGDTAAKTNLQDLYK